jgi:exosome complex component RRP43
MSKSVSLPKATVLPSSIVQADSSKKTRPLKLHRLPVSSTFCVFSNPKVTLSDPNDSEESLSKETVSIILDTEGTILYVHKSGGSVCDPEMMKDCFTKARARASMLKELIEGVIV